MTTNVVPNAARERELLARLGLGPGASDDEVEAAHDDIVRFLEAAPGSLRGWARGRLSDADQTYAILRGGIADSAPAARPAPALPSPPVRATVPAARPAQGGRSNGRHMDDDEAALLDEQNGHPSTAGQTRNANHPRRGQGTAAGRPRADAASLGFLAGPMRRYAIVGGLVVAIAAVAFVGFKLGEPSVPGITGSPVPGTTAAAVDAAAITALMEKLSANPKDVAALQDLANLYYAGGDFQTASTWLEKIIAIDPKNVTALLGFGAAAYNLGDYTGAESAWRSVLAIDEKNVEAHYDLGWMYLSKDPPDVGQVRTEWTRVIALDPTSDAAQTALSHLQRLDPSFSPPPAPSTAPTAPVPSVAPATPGPS